MVKQTMNQWNVTWATKKSSFWYIIQLVQNLNFILRSFWMHDGTPRCLILKVNISQHEWKVTERNDILVWMNVGEFLNLWNRLRISEISREQPKNLPLMFYSKSQSFEYYFNVFLDAWWYPQVFEIEGQYFSTWVKGQKKEWTFWSEWM